MIKKEGESRKEQKSVFRRGRITKEGAKGDARQYDPTSKNNMKTAVNTRGTAPDGKTRFDTSTSIYLNLVEALHSRDRDSTREQSKRREQTTCNNHDDGE
jgi:hypothetical protein